ncbi:MAG TPA: DNA-processing protein DprA [Steroidobacteraceae bacterium]|nr:DNA-processing protein DprA [Steroidobacteraceae bacterium]
MTADLFADGPEALLPALRAPSGTGAPDLPAQTLSPMRELGAYEALWCRPGSGLRAIAALLRDHPGSLPSDFVPPAEGRRCAQLALAAIRVAGIRHFGVRVQGTGEYPPRLHDAAHPVALLYFRGRWALADTPSVAIVGTRAPSAQGRRRAARLARLCVADGLTVVSGLARGIDTVAHGTALAEGGHTIAVLGTPITASYPPENRQLQRRIAAEQLLISQVPILHHAALAFPARRRFFPERNATISALSGATIIVEAGETSGTLIQARHALRQGRPLFILDSCFRRPGLTWPARFAQQGAIRVSDYGEIRQHLAARRGGSAAAQLLGSAAAPGCGICAAADSAALRAD